MKRRLLSYTIMYLWADEKRSRMFHENDGFDENLRYVNPGPPGLAGHGGGSTIGVLKFCEGQK